jgi:hypothetical protein
MIRRNDQHRTRRRTERCARDAPDPRVPGAIGTAPTNDDQIGFERISRGQDLKPWIARCDGDLRGCAIERTLRHSRLQPHHRRRVTTTRAQDRCKRVARDMERGDYTSAFGSGWRRHQPCPLEHIAREISLVYGSEYAARRRHERTAGDHYRRRRATEQSLDRAPELLDSAHAPACPPHDEQVRLVLLGDFVQLLCGPSRPHVDRATYRAEYVTERGERDSHHLRRTLGHAVGECDTAQIGWHGRNFDDVYQHELCLGQEVARGPARRGERRRTEVHTDDDAMRRRAIPDGIPQARTHVASLPATAPAGVVACAIPEVPSAL